MYGFPLHILVVGCLVINALTLWNTCTYFSYKIMLDISHHYDCVHSFCLAVKFYTVIVRAVVWVVEIDINTDLFIVAFTGMNNILVLKVLYSAIDKLQFCQTMFTQYSE